MYQRLTGGVRDTVAYCTIHGERSRPSNIGPSQTLRMGGARDKLGSRTPKFSEGSKRGKLSQLRKPRR